jgi:methylase of polypeptide subunit release factors
VTTTPGPAATVRHVHTDVGTLLLPGEFATFTGPFARGSVRDARGSAKAIHALIACGEGVILRGEFRYVDAVYRYCQRFDRELVPSDYFVAIEDHRERRAAFTQERRDRLHRLLVEADGHTLPNVSEAPASDDLTDWFDLPAATGDYLIPYRRLQRILTDMERARQGVAVDAIGDSLTIRPHVYVPTDQSVPAMYTDYAHLIQGSDVLDVGTGTGVLAILAAKLGARSVVATDVSADAVENARANVSLTGMSDVVQVRDPAPLFEATPGEAFDVVMFNVPWLDGEPQTRYDVARYDPGFQTLRDFLAGCPGRLRAGGVALVQLSDIAAARGSDPVGVLRAQAQACGMTIASTDTISRRSRTAGGTETVYVFELRVAADSA